MAVETTPFTEHHYQVGAHRIRGIVEGDGPAIVLLHGLGSRLEEYHGITELFRPHFRVYIWDQPGDGLSSSPDHPQTLSDRADIVAEVIDHLGLAPVNLMGASQGGFVAFKLMARHPKLVKKALLISPAGGWETKPLLSDFLGQVGNFPLRVPFFLISTYIQLNMCYSMSYEKRFEQINAAMKHLFTTDLDRTSRNWFYATSMAMADSVLDEVDRIEAPVRMLWGSHDYGMPPSQGKALVKRLKKGELEIVEGCGHAMATERPEYVLEEARKWFGV